MKMSIFIKDLFVKPIDRSIDGVIKADDTRSIALEVEEYVLTSEIEKSLSDFLGAYNEHNTARQNGVWISGFFGSGKSHLLKMLALLLENNKIAGTPVLTQFLSKCEDEFLKAELKKACTIPSKSVLFNIDQKADTNDTKRDPLIFVFEKVFNEMCGYYGKQGYIAQFERDLDSRNLYKLFQDNYEKISGKKWLNGRTQAILEGNNIAKAYSQTTGETENIWGILDKYRKDYNLTIEDFANMVKEYIDRQGKGFRLNFFVDEAGQFIADNTQRMLKLQSLAEALATICDGRAWIFVTAQEDMTDVLGEINKNQANDFSKIQARFAHRMKLTSANVDEVIRKRLLAKKPEFIPDVHKLYEDQHCNFRTIFSFADGTLTYRNYEDIDDFTSSYPFVPYQFTLLQNAILTLSEHNLFEGRHNSVGERSMIGIFQSVAKDLMKATLGSLASFDSMFEGIRCVIKTNVIRTIYNLENTKGKNDILVRVLKVLFLVKYVRNFHASAQNIAVLLHSSFEGDPNFDGNPKDLVKNTQEALNKLEFNSYVQCNSGLYEYLTDEEQEIEKEIKNVKIDLDDIHQLLDQMIFEKIIGGSKIQCEMTRQYYTFSKKMDGKVLNGKKEMSIHILTPWNSDSTNKTLLTEAFAQDELVIELPKDSRLLEDVSLYLKTIKYVKQNSNIQNENIRRILDTRMNANNVRENEIKEHLDNLLRNSSFHVRGHKLELSSEKPKTLIEKACQEVIHRVYNQLGMITKIPVGKNIENYFTNQPDLGEITEAESEVLGIIKNNETKGLRTTIKSLKDNLTIQPYGWHDGAIIAVVARLVVRRKLEMRMNGELLDSPKRQIGALSSASGFANVTLELQETYTTAQIRKVKDFYKEFFKTPLSSTEPRQIGKDITESLQELVETLTCLDTDSSRYPILQNLKKPLQNLRQLAERAPVYFFTELTQDQIDSICEDNENFFEPIQSFIKGNGKEIFDQALEFLQDAKTNLMYIHHEEVDEMREILKDNNCSVLKRIPRLKELTQLLQSRISECVQNEIKKVTTQLQSLYSDFKAKPDFSIISQEEQLQLTREFQTQQGKFKEMTQIPVIREQLHDFEQNGLKRLNEKLYTLAHPVKEEPAGVVIASVPMTKPEPSFPKPWLENEADLDAYFSDWKKKLDELKDQLRAEIQQGKRIQL